ncbi:helix-turn-helix transcriptional regulator [Subtercola boreus]|uniref:MmyB-like transcription regulator ligand binding domain-containing protein n=1 Tax=Subtercola boreus TaxID=120213 RepID=A0A3E0W940_9MICO|nr:helix-turn-helix transcriptional regulator [Subtercola boreus]RFA20067.1 hypothetical protein B7R24_10870 [Subtercola boreus]RFA20197.1 hypothetical protein B7R23_10810 [Subtercola boreus]RFA26523.1 hypothetical protein B7R25_10935 [Subtercola boreus]
MESGRQLAEFLRARRSVVDPSDVALPLSPSPRRVAGLRREEVAMLAGISSDYYLRLEQAREHHPSPAVLEGLTRALCLDAAAAAHLRRLARPPIRGTLRLDNSVSPSLIALIESMPTIPTYLLNRYLDIIYVNRLAPLLSPGFRVGNNLLKLTFHPAVPRDAYWRATARRTIGYFRSSVDPLDEGPELAQLLSELHALDPEFTAIWNLHETGSSSGYPSAFHHKAIGSVELRYQTFDLPGTGGQMLGMFLPPPGGPSAEKLQMLALLADDLQAAEGVRPAPRKTGTTTAE